MSSPINGTSASRAFDIRAAIASAVPQLPPPSTLLALCFTANHYRIAALHERLAAIEAEMEERRVRRNAAARRLIALAGKSRPRAATDNTVAFPVFQKAAQ